jgi:hypothetical protein
MFLYSYLCDFYVYLYYLCYMKKIKHSLSPLQLRIKAAYLC